MLEYLTIGEIVNVHGVRGAVKVIPLTDDPTRFKKLKSARVVHRGNTREYDVQSVQIQSKFVIVKLSGIEDRDAAAALRGAEIEVSRKDAVKLPQDTYFICDLIGCKVVEPDGNVLGVVDDVFSTGSNDVYSVKDPQGRNLMIPAIAKVIKNVDVEKGEIAVELLPGLKEVYL